jgi:hypothetical protein
VIRDFPSISISCYSSKATRFVGQHSKVERRTGREWVDDDDHMAWDDDAEGCSTTGHWKIVVEERTTLMAYYEVAGFRFHRLIDTPPLGVMDEIKDLGDWMSKATARPIPMTLKDAKATLLAFLAADAMAA